jgi:hypothetical protein
MTILYEIRKPLTRRYDGLQVYPDHVVIYERLGGEQMVRGIEGVELDPGLLDRTLRIRTAGHTYVLRRLPREKAAAAAKAIRETLEG